MLFGCPQLPSQKSPPKSKPQMHIHISKSSEPSEPMGDELSRRIRAFVIVKEDNLKTMPGSSVSSRGSVGLETKRIDLNTANKSF